MWTEQWGPSPNCQSAKCFSTKSRLTGEMKINQKGYKINFHNVSQIPSFPFFLSQFRSFFCQKIIESMKQKLSQRNRLYLTEENLKHFLTQEDDVCMFMLPALTPQYNNAAYLRVENSTQANFRLSLFCFHTHPSPPTYTIQWQCTSNFWPNVIYP
jgi:hypothetical protein